MDKMERDRLRYRRQFLLAPREIDCPFSHGLERLPEGWCLYVHPDLPLAKLNRPGNNFYLLGDIFDFRGDHKGNEEILREVVDASPDSKTFLKNLEPYTGCYVVIFVFGGSIRLAGDATATRKLFFRRESGQTWCASHLHLLARVLNIPLSGDPSKTAYMNSPRFEALNKGGIAATTAYDGINQVLPNHCLEAGEGTVTRFWPDEPREPLSVKEVVELSTTMIGGFMHHIASRYDIMLPITAGKDSRTLLAATREIRENVFYYINRNSQSDLTIPDFTLPAELTRRLGIEYHILDTDIRVDPGFEEIFHENNPHALKQYLPMIYNYYLHFGNRVNIPGSVATGGQWWYPVFRKHKTTDTLLDINQLGSFPHAREAYASWLDGCRPWCERTGFELLDLFYWEERLGNWGTQVQVDKDMAQLDINPLNSRLLVKIMLSVEPIHALEFGSYPVNRGINMNLWPETMSMPINPGMKNRMLRLVERMGLLGLLYRINFR